jgi:hypothetical protein
MIAYQSEQKILQARPWLCSDALDLEHRHAVAKENVQPLAVAKAYLKEIATAKPKPVVEDTATRHIKGVFKKDYCLGGGVLLENRDRCVAKVKSKYARALNGTWLEHQNNTVATHELIHG